MRENLDESLNLMFGDEGGYVNAATDAGGPTKYGITHKTLAAWRGVPRCSPADVKMLSLDEAEAIYRKSYWGPAGGDVLPVGLDYAVFDFAVNSGPMTAVKKLQVTLGVEADGWIGPATLNAIANYPGGVTALIEHYCDERMAFLRSLKSKKTGFPVNGRGWTIRVTGIDPAGRYKPEPGVVGNAKKMAQKARTVPPSRPMETSTEAKAKASPANTVFGALMKPDVLLPATGAGLTAAAPVVMGSNALQLAISFGIVVVIVIGAIYAVRRILRTA